MGYSYLKILSRQQYSVEPTVAAPGILPVNMIQPLSPAARAVAELQHSVRLPCFNERVLYHGQPVFRRLVYSLIGAPYNTITKPVKNVTDKSQIKNVTKG